MIELRKLTEEDIRAIREDGTGRGRDFSHTILKGADLRGADLSGANLSGADLCGAYLRGADLCDAYLAEADLHGALLQDADLRTANLDGADLQEACLCGANLSEAKLEGANLCRANLRNVNLWDASLYGANLERVRLWGANLQGADIRYCYGNGVQIYTLQLTEYHVAICITDNTRVMAIGCQQHSIDDWMQFDDEEIWAMDERVAVDWWRTYKSVLQAVINDIDRWLA